MRGKLCCYVLTHYYFLFLSEQKENKTSIINSSISTILTNEIPINRFIVPLILEITSNKLILGICVICNEERSDNITFSVNVSFVAPLWFFIIFGVLNFDQVHSF